MEQEGKGDLRTIMKAVIKDKYIQIKYKPKVLFPSREIKRQCRSYRRIPYEAFQERY